MTLYAGQHADIAIIQHGDRADQLVNELIAIANTSTSTTTRPDGSVRVHLTQADADTGAESLRKLAASFDVAWTTLITITPVREMP
jgi:hypothetical protein